MVFATQWLCRLGSPYEGLHERITALGEQLEAALDRPKLARRQGVDQPNAVSLSLRGRFSWVFPVADNCHRMSWILRDRLTSRFVSERCRRLDRHLAGRRCRALGPTGATPALFLLSNEAPELARIRGIPPGIDLRSPSRHPDILGGDDLLIKVEEMREATGYRLPVSVKLGAGE